MTKFSPMSSTVQALLSRSLKKASLLSLCVLGSFVAAGAQTLVTGDVVGRVTDPTGAGVARAKLTITNLGDNSKQTVMADKSGDFRFTLLRPGTYALHEEGSGLSAEISEIPVNVGQATPLNIVAKPNGAMETIEVTSSLPLLQPGDGNISTSFTSKQIDSLPIPGGDISNLPFSTPGANVSTGEGYGNFNVFGLPAVSNLFTTNGSDLMDAYLNLPNSGASNNVLGANEISEAVVVVNGYTGQYGRLAGAQVNFTTRSGTNQFHGNANFFYNSSGLNANDWFIKAGQVGGGKLNAQPHAVSRQWGGRIGGPIWKDKLFGFFDSEGLRYVLPGGGNTIYIPSPSFATAVTSHIAATQPSELAYYQKIFALYAGANGASSAPADISATDGDCGDFKGTVVGGVTFGQANPCALKFVPNNNNLNTEQLYTARIDANLSPKDQINVRFKHDWGVQATSTDPINPAFSANSVQPEYEGQLNETHIFSPKLVNTFTMASLYYSAVFGPPNFGAAIATFPTTIGFGDSPFATLGGSDNSYPSGRNVSQYQFTDDLSYTLGKNSFKAGFNFRRYNITNFAPLAGASGSTSFGSTTDFYNGLLTNTSTHTGGSTTTEAFANIAQAHLAIYSIGVYFQDQVALTPKLNVTASIRFDRGGNPKCANSCFVRFAAPFDQLAHGATIPYNQSILTGQTNSFPSVEAVTTQPRLGFAYSPFGPGTKTVIRGGAGLFADLPVASILTRFITSAPNYTSFTVTPTGSAVSPTTVTNPSSYGVVPGMASSGYAAAKSSNTAFQAGFAGGGTLASIQAAVAAAGSVYSTPSYTGSTVNNFRNPKFAEWNLELQQGLGSHDVFDINYVGNYGMDILMVNAGVNAYASCSVAVCPNGFGDLPRTAIDSRFTAVSNLTNTGYSNYNGLVASYRHDGHYGLTTSINYTYGHALDTTSNGGIEGFNVGTGDTYPLTYIDPYNQGLNYGNADYDTRNQLSANYTWILPYKFSNKLMRTALQGWAVSGTLFDKSGSHFSVIRGSLSAKYTSSTNGGSVLGGLINKASYNCGRPIAGGTTPCLASANYATSTTQYQYGFGNQNRNSYVGPGYFDTDMQLSKETTLFENTHENVKLKFGVNAFNLLNHPNFQVPNNNLASSAFGKTQADVPPVSSPYGNFQGAGVSGRILQVMAGISF